MTMDDFDSYLEIVERARQTWRGRIDVLLGIESDFAPGLERWIERLHTLAPFHFALGSVHCHLRQYRDRYYQGRIRDFQVTYFEHLAEAAETGLYDCISHPDLVKNCFPRAWEPEAILDVIRTSLDRIARTGTAMELNTSGLLKSVPEMNPGRLILEEMREREIPVVVGSDAHRPERVAADFEAALDLLEDAGYTHVSHFVERTRRELPIPEAAASLDDSEPATRSIRGERG